MCQRDCHCPTKCYLAGIVCCILAFAAFFQKATEGNTTKYVVRKIQRTENSGKGRENGGKGRTLKIEFLPETCPKGFCVFSSGYSSRETLLKAAIQVSQCRWKPMLETVL